MLVSTSKNRLAGGARYLSYWPGPLVLGAAAVVGMLIFIVPVPQALLLIAVPIIVLAALIQPLSALALALVAGPFGALESFHLGGLAFDSGQLLLILALAAWIGRGLIRRQFNIVKSPLLLPALIYIGAGFVSLLRATDVLLGVIELLKWIEIVAILLMVADLGRDLGSGRQPANGRSDSDAAAGIWWIVAMLLFAGVVQAGIGIWQFALRGEGPEHFLVLDRFYRAYGTFEQPNPFGGYMNLTALLALGIIIGIMTAWLLQKRDVSLPSFKRGRILSPRTVLLFLAVAVVASATLMGLVFSWSRGAWMGFLAGLAAIVVFWPRRLVYGLLVLVIAFVGFIFLYQANLLPAAVSDRITGFAEDLAFGDVRGVDINDENYSVLERLAHWQAALDMARDRPWFGVGFGNYAAAYERYALINWPDPLGHAHNYYLNSLAEIGIFGLGAYLLLWGAIFWQTFRILRRETWPARGVALGLLGIWTAITVHHVVDKLYVNNIYIHLGVLLGLLQLMDLHAVSNGAHRNQMEKRA